MLSAQSTEIPGLLMQLLDKSFGSEACLLGDKGDVVLLIQILNRVCRAGCRVK